MNKIIPELWAEEWAKAMGVRYEIHNELLRQQRKELRWLRQSLEADMLPEWCVRMVIEKWIGEQVDEWTTL